MTASTRAGRGPAHPRPDPQAAGPAEMREFMTAFPTGVAIVAAVAADGRPRGMTCTSMCSVSLAPPTLLVCLREGSPTLQAVLHRRAFAVNLLDEAGRATAELFASGSPDRFDRTPWSMDAHAGGPHLLGPSHAVADCRLVRAQTVRSHRVLFGEVTRVRTEPTGTPLLYGYRRYGRWPAQ